MWQQRQDRACPGCGGDTVETTDPANEDAYTVEHRRCHKCAAKTSANRQLAEDKRGGLLVYVVGPDATVA